MKNYKIGSDFVIQEDRGKVILFGPQTSQLYTLNKTATLIFTNVISGLTIKEIAQLLVKNYTIEKMAAKKEVVETIDYFLNEEILQ